MEENVLLVVLYAFATVDWHINADQKIVVGCSPHSSSVTTTFILVGSFVVGREAVWSEATSFGSEATGNCDTNLQKVVGNGLQMSAIAGSPLDSGPIPSSDGGS